LPTAVVLLGAALASAACGRVGFDRLAIDRGDGPPLDVDMAIDVTDLVALYRFNESAWTGAPGEVLDSSGGGEHGTANNGATTAAGQLGRAADFAAALGQSVSFGVAPGWKLAMPFSIVLWLKLKQLPSTAGGSFRIASKSDATGNQREWAWTLEAAADRLVFEKSNDGDLPFEEADTIMFAPDDVGVWVHCAFVAAGDGGYRAYRDGVQVSTGAFASTAIFQGTADARIGNRSPSGRDSDALVDELAIWARELTDAEIENLHARQQAGDPSGEIPGL
jgi:hypothetical protein